MDWDADYLGMAKQDEPFSDTEIAETRRLILDPNRPSYVWGTKDWLSFGNRKAMEFAR